MLGRLLLLCLLALTPACTEALADQPLKLNDPLAYARVGAPIFGTSFSAPTSSGIAGYVGQAGVASAVADVHLFDFGTRVQVSCSDQPAVFCWVMDAEMTVAATGVVTDPDSGTGIGQDGRGSCFRVLAGTYNYSTVWRANFRQPATIGRRAGYCTVNATTLDWPCNEDGDCSTSGVCVLTGTQNNPSPFDRVRGAFLTAIAASAAACFVSEEI